MRAQLQALGQSLPALWARGHFTAAQQKELLRSLIRHVLVARPVPDMVEAKIVWVSGAVTLLQVHPPTLRQSDVHDYAQFVERVLALGDAGYQDREIAQRLTAEGFRGARSPRISRALVGEVRRARGQISLTEQFRTQAKLEGQWTVFGLSQVPRGVIALFPRHVQTGSGNRRCHVSRTSGREEWGLAGRSAFGEMMENAHFPSRPQL